MGHQILRAGVGRDACRVNGLECLCRSNGLIRLAVTTGRGSRTLSRGPEARIGHRLTNFGRWPVQIESLGPLVTLAPGASVTHDEVWRLRRTDLPVGDEAEALRLIEALGS